MSPFKIILCVLGSRCQEAGINRSSFSNPFVPDERHITRGVLLELSSTFGSELYACVNHIYPNRYSHKTVNSELKQTKSTHSKLNKFKSRDDRAVRYLEEEIEFDEDAEKRKAEQASVVMHESCKNCKENGNKIRALRKEKHKLVNETESQQEKLSNLSQKVEILADECEQKSLQTSKLEKELQNKERVIKQMQAKIERVNSILTIKKDEVRRLKSRSAHHSRKKKDGLEA